MGVFCVLCRSKLARDGLESAAGYQAPSVIVDDHRERARSYRQARSIVEVFPAAHLFPAIDDAAEQLGGLLGVIAS